MPDKRRKRKVNRNNVATKVVEKLPDPIISRDTLSVPEVYLPMDEFKEKVRQSKRAGLAETSGEPRLDPKVLQNVIQKLSDGMTEIAIAQPMDPFLWMAEYLRKTGLCSSIPEPEIVHTQTEYILKRNYIEQLYFQTVYQLYRKKEFIQQAMRIEYSLFVEEHESAITSDDLLFLKEKKALNFTEWCPQRQELQPLRQSYITEHMECRQYSSHNNINFAIEQIVPHIIDGFLALMKNTGTKKPIEFLSNYFLEKSHVMAHTFNERESRLENFKILEDKLHLVKRWAKDQNEETSRCGSIVEELLKQVELKDVAISWVSVPTMAIRREEQVRGVTVNGKQYWLDPDREIDMHTIPDDKARALRRAELILMHQDETNLKATIKYLREYHAAVVIQSRVRCFFRRRSYVKWIAARSKAASFLQRVYRDRLYYIALQLPPWCVVGGECMIAKSAARRAGKDFPAGTFETETNVRLEHLKSRCRNDERCAGFATDGTLKRYIPRQLSKLEVFNTKKHIVSTSDKKIRHGLYVKVYPMDDDDIVTSAMIMAIPENRFGNVKVVFDGTKVHDDIPVNKCTTRWNKSFDLEQECWIYTDRITKRQTPFKPTIYKEVHERYALIDRRVVEYQKKMEEVYHKRVVASAVILQCAWRGRKARQRFEQSLHLRAREQDRALLVEKAAAKAKRKKKWFKFK